MSGSTLPFRIDRYSNTITLPAVNLEDLDPQAAITITEATKSMRGRTRFRVGRDGREREQLRHVHVAVARRWARRGWRVQLEDGAYTLLLPAVKYSGQLLTMAAWVEAFEAARARLSVTISPARQAAAAMQ